MVQLKYLFKLPCYPSPLLERPWVLKAVGVDPKRQSRRGVPSIINELFPVDETWENIG
jgi:hypothetical protein